MLKAPLLPLLLLLLLLPLPLLVIEVVQVEIVLVLLLLALVASFNSIRMNGRMSLVKFVFIVQKKMNRNPFYETIL